MTLASLVRKCPKCADYVQLYGNERTGRCFHCGARTDFRRFPTVEERIGNWFRARAAAIRWPDNLWMHCARGTLLVAMTVVALMLTLSGSIENTNRDPWVSFKSPEIETSFGIDLF